ncbi:hypothetical protein Acr_08g0015080 [Actinidia rufa]|uniref:Uncharacterized protein n=1 Tax=Actinidia rufa TaxID=165716 RepID=A0A7J0F351_9ERIC|nr:hypothetical protein Acr_08g0015080 [Actinidia rufa]
MSMVDFLRMRPIVGATDPSYNTETVRMATRTVPGMGQFGTCLDASIVTHTGQTTARHESRYAEYCVSEQVADLRHGWGLACHVVGVSIQA